MYQIIKKFSRLLDKKQQHRAIILVVMMVIGALLEVLGVGLIIPVLSVILAPDIMETNEIVKKICALLNITTYQTFILFIIVVLILVFIIKNLFLIFQCYVQNRYVYNNRYAVQQRLLHAYMSRPYEYYLTANLGEIMHVINGSAVNTFTLLSTILGFFAETIVSGFLIIAIFYVAPGMTVFVAGVIGILLLVIIKIIRPKLREEGELLQKYSSLAGKWLIQSINGIKEIKVSQTEAFFEAEYRESCQKVVSAEKKNAILGQTPRLLIEMICINTMLALIAIMILMGQSMETLIPLLGAFALAAIKLMPSANRIVSAMNAIALLEPALDMLLDNIKVLEDSKISEKRIDLDAAPITLEKEISLKDVTFHYPNSQVKILDQVNLTIPVGTSLGLIGTSGAGKTTVVDILLGLFKPQTGAVLSDDRDITENFGSWLSHVGYIPQMIYMLDDTIRANVAFGHGDLQGDDNAIWEALEKAQLADFVHSLPHGIETQIGERGVRLSGGQRQRIGIARALYLNPELLIFDEATSALDTETEMAIMESIQKLHGKKTMVIITHRLRMVSGCDMVCRVAGGKIEKV